MDLLKNFVTLTFMFILVAEVLARPAHNRDITRDLETLVKDINDELVTKSKKIGNNNHRQRRHIQTQQIAMMEFCLTNRRRCRQALEELKRQNPRLDVSVVIIEK